MSVRVIKARGVTLVMPSHHNKRAARLVVKRFGADPRKVRRVYLEALQAQQQGREVDLVEELIRTRVIDAAQAAELREALDETQIDPDAPPRDNHRAVDPTFEVPGERTAPIPAPPPTGVSLQSIVEYRVLRKLGEGGMGEVYLAFDESSERLVAIKVLWSHLATNPALVERFKREAAHTCKLDHPNIVRGLGSGQDAQTRRYYLVMEYVDGPSVQTLLDRDGKIPIGDAVHITLDIAHALEHAQSHNIVHRDIKPENILTTRSGVAKLADLGLSKATDQVSHLTATRQGFGTPYYMPYEQAMNARSADGRSDIYALGATLYHMVTGQVPFKGETQVDILEKKEAGLYPPASLVNPDVPPELDRILDRMLARDRRDRYQTASELIIDLQRSDLAAPVLSFVDKDAALQDPVVRARAVVAHQATQPDLTAPKRVRGNGDWWYLRFRDRHGKISEIKLTTEEVLRRIRQGRLGHETVAARSQEEQYQPLEAFGQFRAALGSQTRTIVKPAAAAAPVSVLEEPPEDDLQEDMVRNWIAWFVIGSCIALVLLAIGLLYLLRP